MGSTNVGRPDTELPLQFSWFFQPRGPELVVGPSLSSQVWRSENPLKLPRAHCAFCTAPSRLLRGHRNTGSALSFLPQTFKGAASVNLHVERERGENKSHPVLQIQLNTKLCFCQYHVSSGVKPSGAESLFFLQPFLPQQHEAGVESSVLAAGPPIGKSLKLPLSHYQIVFKRG